MHTYSNSNSQGNSPDVRDSDLLRRYVKEQSEEAFADLGRRYAGLVYATCLREIGDRTLAEDAAQGVFLLLSQKASALRGQDTLAGWLYSAARYVSKNLIKQEQRRKNYEARALSEMTPEPKAENPLWESIELHFYDALNRLKAPEREAILLRFVQEQSLAEVGTSLGVSENTARMRINCALEKVRKHLSLAGIAVSAVVLIALLEERSAQAAPASLLTRIARSQTEEADPKSAERLAQVVRQTSSQLALQTMGRRLAPGISVLLVIFVVYQHSLPERLSSAEQRRFFALMVGTWQGTLTFADDKTRQQFTYPTRVTVSQPQDSLQLTASYTGSSRVDITTLTVDPQTGAVSVDNGGAKSSHILSSIGEIRRESGSGIVFQGFNSGTRRDTRLHFSLQNNQLTVQEEFRLPGATAYLFRNRFALTRK